MGTTATLALRYPEVTDRVADGANAIKRLAEDVDSKTAPKAPPAARHPVTGLYHVDGYGAVGDGTTNDLAAIQAAINAAGAAGGGRVVGQAGKLYAVNAMIVCKSNVTIDGLRLLGLTPNQQIVSLQDCADATVQGCHFTGSGSVGDGSGTGGNGVAGRGAIWGVMGSSIGPTRCRILNNTIDTVGTGGIVFDQANDLLIDGNLVRQTAEHGVYVSTNSHDVVISNNHIIDAGRYNGVSTVNGIKITNNSRIHIVGNVIRNALEDAIMFESGAVDCSARDNLIHDNGGFGLRVNDGSSHIDLSDNIVIDNVREAVRILGGDGIKVSGNKIRANGIGCILINAEADGVTVTDNYLTQLGGSYSLDVRAPNVSISGNVCQATGADSGFVIRAGVVGCTIHGDNIVPAGISNSAGTGLKRIERLGAYGAGTTLGSLVAKLEAFDATGASLGFVPVYTSIT